MKLMPASVVSYQDNIFWQKKDKSYYLICKGEAIQDHTTSEWKGDDLYVTDTKTKISIHLPRLCQCYRGCPEGRSQELTGNNLDNLSYLFILFRFICI